MLIGEEMNEEDLLDKAHNYYLDGKYEKSINCYNQVLRINPDKHICFLGIGKAYFGMEEYEKAIEFYDMGIKFNGPESLFNEAKGKALLEIGEFDKALKCFNKAIIEMPDFADFWINKGISLFCLDNYEEAIFCYDKALSLNSNDDMAWFRKAETYVELEDYKKALECVNISLEITLINGIIKLNLKAEILKLMGDYEEALEVLNEIKNYLPEDLENILNIANTLIELERYGELVDFTDSALEIHPDSIELEIIKLRALIEVRNIKEAKKLFLKIDLSDIDVKCIYSQYIQNKYIMPYKIENNEELLEFSEILIQITPESSKYLEVSNNWENKGHALFNLGRYQEALEAYNKSISLYVKLYPEEEYYMSGNYTYYQIVKTLIKMNKTDEALGIIDKYLSIEPDGDLWRWKADTLTDLKRYEEAIFCFDKALEYDQECGDYNYEKGEILLTLNRYKEALACFDKALVASPVTTRYKFSKGKALYWLEEYNRALDCFEDLLPQWPDSEELCYFRNSTIEKINENSKKQNGDYSRKQENRNSFEKNHSDKNIYYRYDTLPLVMQDKLKKMYLDDQEKISLEIIKKQYHFWLEILHPDKNIDKPPLVKQNAENKLKEINRIYKELCEYFNK